MVKLLQLRRSARPGKKYDAVLDTGSGRTKTVSFGDASMEDYTQHGDQQRKKSYLARHAVRENWSDPTTAGFWAKNILWNKPSVSASLAETKRRFNL